MPVCAGEKPSFREKTRFRLTFRCKEKKRRAGFGGFKKQCERRTAYGVCVLLILVGEGDGFEEVHGGAESGLLVVAVEEVFQDLNSLSVDA